MFRILNCPRSHKAGEPCARGGSGTRTHAWAGVAKRVPYSLRHTFASLSIAAGVTLFELSRFMGTSPAMLDKTYGHLLPDALDRGRAALDSFLAADTAEAFGH